MSPDTPRLLPARDYLAIKGATRDLVDAAGGHKRVGDISRTTTPKISEACAPHAMHRFAAIDVVADLEAETGTPFVTRCLADLAGFDLTPRSIKRDPDMLGHLARIARESGDVVAGLSAAMADNRLTEKEKALLRKEARDAIERLRELDAALGPEARG